MKAKIYKNISLVRVPVKQGVREYYLPQNVDWANQKIDNLLIVAPQQVCLDPMDGTTPVMDMGTIDNLFVTLYDKANKELMHYVSCEQLMYQNNNPLEINAELNLSLCKLTFTQDPAQDYTLLVYVTWRSREEDYCDIPRRSVTATFPLQANEEITLRHVIHDYVHALPGKIRGLICWNAESYPAWITLRDKQLSYQMANILSVLCRPDKSGSYAYDTQAALFLVDDLDIDFDNSTIREAANIASTQQITFLY